MGRSLPSIDVVVESAKRAAARFPVVLGAGLLSAALAVWMISQEHPSVALQAWLAAATLALPLLFAVTTLVEIRQWPTLIRAAAFVAAIALLVVIGWAWLDWTDAARVIRYGLFSSAFHLAAAFLAQARRHEPQGFWQFNRVLFLRVLLTALYSAVLFLGLAAALGAINVLFAAHIKPQAFLQLFTVDVFVFGTWFLLAGLPSPWTILDHDTSYPDGLRKFAQFVLIPLVVLYLLILTVYLGKVIVTRQWPSGWIGYLVSFVTMAGMLSWLLVRPLEDRAEYAWVKPFTRGFYVVLLPSIVMLWLALGKRISQYGLTERRTIAVAGAVWLSGVALYYVFTRSRNIKIIPISLCACILCISAGPLSAFTLSRRDQSARLASVLTRNGLLQNGRMVRATRMPPDSDVVTINEAVWYLRETHGPRVFDAWLSDSARRTMAGRDSSEGWVLVNQQAEAVVDVMGLPMHRRGNIGVMRSGGKDSVTLSFNSRTLEAMSVSGYAYVAPLSSFRVFHDTVYVGDSVRATITADSTFIELTRGGATLLRFSVDSAADAANRAATSIVRADSTGAPIVAVKSSPLPQPIVLDARSGAARARLVLTNLAVSQHGGHWHLQQFTGTLLVSAARDVAPDSGSTVRGR